MNSYLFEWHQKYDILITKFVIEYNWKRKNQLFTLYIHTLYTYYIYILQLHNSFTEADEHIMHH